MLPFTTGKQPSNQSEGTAQLGIYTFLLQDCNYYRPSYFSDVPNCQPSELEQKG